MLVSWLLQRIFVDVLEIESCLYGNSDHFICVSTFLDDDNSSDISVLTENVGNGYRTK